MKLYQQLITTTLKTKAATRDNVSLYHASLIDEQHQTNSDLVCSFSDLDKFMLKVKIHQTY